MLAVPLHQPPQPITGNRELPEDDAYISIAASLGTVTTEIPPLYIGIYIEPLKEALLSDDGIFPTAIRLQQSDGFLKRTHNSASQL